MSAACFNDDSITASDIERKIQGKLTIGVSQAQVIEFLRSQGVGYSSYQPSSTTVSEGVIYSMFNSKSQEKKLIRKSIQVIFYFSHNNLVKYELKEILTGP